jgi:VWA domain-containing protein
MQRRTRRLERLFSLSAPGRRELVTAAVALALLPALVAVAAAQPVVIHAKALTERLDAQVFVVFDTSRSMSARSGPDAPTRLARAKQEARALIPQLGDIPVGIATFTDRILPALMPTTTVALALRTVNQSVRIDEPPPSLRYHGRASTLQALEPVARDRLFPPGVRHPILVVFTDGEMRAPPPLSGYSFAQQVTIPPLFVHVWGPTEHIYSHGRINPGYQSDPTSGSTLTHFAALTHGRLFPEGDLGGLLDAIRAQAGSKPATTTLLGFTRVALGPWFLLAGVVPLGFLFWRRNL